MTKVGLVRGDDRFANVLRALENAGDEVKAKIRGDVLIKVNTVVGGGSLADTQPDALRAVLEFLKPLRTGRICVGESSMNPHPMEIFRTNGFLTLQKDYEVEFVDFNALKLGELELDTIEKTLVRAPICRAYEEFDCLISLSVPTAHRDAVVTLSGKNMMGFLVKGEEWRIHGVREFGLDENIVRCTHTIHKNLRRLLRHVRPDIGILDGFHSFEGGPVPQCAKGDIVWPRIAVAGADFVAVDTVAATVLGFNPRDVGYLTTCVEDGYGTGDLQQIEVVGTSIERARLALKPPPRMETLVSWRE